MIFPQFGYFWVVIRLTKPYFSPSIAIVKEAVMLLALQRTIRPQGQVRGFSQLRLEGKRLLL